MKLFQGELGAPDLIFPPVVTLRDTVDLGSSVSRYAKALLRGFELSNFPHEHHLRVVRVDLSTTFTDDLEHVQVVADVILQDDPPSGIDWRGIGIRVFYTLIAE